jgi:hypothetical protein
MSILELRGGDAVWRETEFGDVGALGDTCDFTPLRSLFWLMMEEIPTLQADWGDSDCDGNMLWCIGGGMFTWRVS